MTNPCDKKTSNNTLSMYMAIGSGIGSDLLPIGSWQFDLQNAILRFNAQLQKHCLISKGRRS